MSGTEPNLNAAKEKLRKLLALARRGIGGEKDNAERMMSALMKKYDLTLKDFDPDRYEEVSHHSFVYTDRWSKDLLLHIICMVLDVPTLSFFRGDAAKTIQVGCTEAQAFEIEFMHEIYLRALKKDMKNFALAFYHKHELFCSAEPSTPPQPMAPEDEAAIMRMIKSVTPVSYRKALKEEL